MASHNLYYVKSDDKLMPLVGNLNPPSEVQVCRHRPDTLFVYGSLRHYVGTLLVLAWRTSELTSKHGMQILRRFETAVLSDVGNC